MEAFIFSNENKSLFIDMILHLKSQIETIFLRISII